MEVDPTRAGPARELRPVRAGRFVAWGNAVLTGQVSPDTAADRIRAGDGPHRVHGVFAAVPDAAVPDAGATLPVVLAGLRTAGVLALQLALPVPGDPLGLPGPPEFNARALATGEAVLAVGEAPVGLVPVVADGGGLVQVRWHSERVSARPLDVPALAEAERELTETLLEVTDALTALDVAGGRGEVAARLAAIDQGPDAASLAPGYPPRAHRVLASARRVAAIADLAAGHLGGTASAAAIGIRAEALRPLARAARRAELAAYNAAFNG